MNQQASVENAQGARRVYAYDQNGNRVSKTDLLGNETVYAYDDLNRRQQTTTPMGRQRQYVYDSEGNLIEQIQANGDTITHAYDSLNRLTTLTTPEGHVDWTYNETGHLIQIDNHHGLNDKTTYAYDDAGQRLTKTVNGQTAMFTYDADGRVTQQVSPDETVDYTYDQNGRRISQTGPEGVLTYQYDYAGRLVRYQRPDRDPVSYAYTPEGLKILGSDFGVWPIFYGYDGDQVISESGSQYAIDYLLL